MLKFYTPTKSFFDIFDELYSTKSDKSLCSCEPKSSLEFTPNCMINKKDDNKYSIQMELAGIIKDDIKISMENGSLTVSGEKLNNFEPNNVLKNYGFKYGKFEKIFTIGQDIDDTNITASYDNGILDITLPIKTEQVSKSKQIQIS